MRPFLLSSFLVLGCVNLALPVYSYKPEMVKKNQDSSMFTSTTEVKQEEAQVITGAVTSGWYKRGVVYNITDEIAFVFTRLTHKQLRD